MSNIVPLFGHDAGDGPHDCPICGRPCGPQGEQRSEWKSTLWKVSIKAYVAFVGTIGGGYCILAGLVLWESYGAGPWETAGAGVLLLFMVLFAYYALVILCGARRPPDIVQHVHHTYDEQIVRVREGERH
jgi:hypothetical protein